MAHQYERTGYRVEQPDGTEQAEEQCAVCQHARVMEYRYDAEGRLESSDTWLKHILDEFGLPIPEPDCPPSDEWLEVEQAVRNMEAAWVPVMYARDLQRREMSVYQEYYIAVESALEQLGETVTANEPDDNAGTV